jgi:Immunoglobulin domain
MAYVCERFSVPAEIIDELSSNDVTVQEGNNVSLRCNATGVPTPQITWHRKSTSIRGLSVRDSRMCRQRSHDGGRWSSNCAGDRKQDGSGTQTSFSVVVKLDNAGRFLIMRLCRKRTQQLVDVNQSVLMLQQQI